MSKTLIEEVAEFGSQLSALLSDAQRYRKLKAMKGHNVYLMRVEGSKEVCVFCYVAPALDSAIDALSVGQISNITGTKASTATTGNS